MGWANIRDNDYPSAGIFSKRGKEELTAVDWIMKRVRSGALAATEQKCRSLAMRAEESLDSPERGGAKHRDKHDPRQST